MRRSVLLLWLVVAALGGFLVLTSWSGDSVPPAPADGTALPAPVVAVSVSGSERATPTQGEPLPRIVVESARAAATPAIELADLTGRVSDSAGRPLAGAEVAASASLAEGLGLLDRELRRDRRDAGTTTTGSDGTYRLPLPAGRPFLIRAAASGLVPAWHAGGRGGMRVDFTLQTGAVLTGTVRRLDGKAVVPDTRIVVRQEVPGGGSVEVGAATSDRGGVFRLEALPAGTVSVDVQPRELAAPRDFEVQLVAGATRVHDIDLLDGLTIRGRVLDATTRKGIAGAEVGEGLLGRTVLTGADGAFALVGFAAMANLSLRIRAVGYGDEERLLRGAGTGPADTATDVEVLLQPGRTVRGVVVDPAGQPRAGVYVAAVGADHAEAMFRSDWRSARTGADGSFAIADLRADLGHELLVLTPGFATTLVPFPVDEAQRRDIDLGVLRLQLAAQVSGVVKDESGRPVVDHDVVLRGHNADRFGADAPPADSYRAIDSYVAERHCRTDDQGRFQFVDVAAGAYRVGAMKFDSHGEVAVPLSVAVGALEKGVELVLARGLAIEGRVQVADGGALPKCHCSIDPEQGQTTSGDVEARPDGSFVCAGLLPGLYTVTVYPYPSEVDRAAGRTFPSRAFAHVVAGTRGLVCELALR